LDKGLDAGDYRNEAETAIRTALKIYESFWPNLPSVGVFYEKLERQRELLLSQAAQLRIEALPIISHLNGAFEHLGVVFEARHTLTAGVERDYEGSHVVLSLNRVRELKKILDADGLALMLNEEIRTAFVLYGKGLQNNPVDAMKVLRELKELNGAVLRYCRKQTPPVIRLTEVPRTPPRAENPTTGHPGPSTATAGASAKVGGMYKPGKNMALLWTWLSDQEWHELIEQTFAPMPDIIAWLRSMDKDGRQAGKWKIQWSARAPGKARQVRMNKT
jgi:hypothetical protein